MRDKQAILAVPQTRDKVQRHREPFLGTSVEASLVHWIQSLVGQNIPVSGSLIQSKARSLAKAIHGEACTFEGTRGWLDRFSRRWGLKSWIMHGADTYFLVSSPFSNWHMVIGL
jgi:hypothetical protein